MFVWHSDCDFRTLVDTVYSLKDQVRELRQVTRSMLTSTDPYLLLDRFNMIRNINILPSIFLLLYVIRLDSRLLRLCNWSVLL